MNINKPNYLYSFLIVLFISLLKYLKLNYMKKQDSKPYVNILLVVITLSAIIVSLMPNQYFITLVSEAVMLIMAIYFIVLFVNFFVKKLRR